MRDVPARAARITIALAAIALIACSATNDSEKDAARGTVDAAAAARDLGAVRRDGPPGDANRAAPLADGALRDTRTVPDASTRNDASMTPDASSTPDTQHDASSPSDVRTEAPRVTCADFPGLLRCEDFDATAEYQDMLWMHENILTHSHRSRGGWDDGPYARLRINDYAGEHGAGIAPGPLDEPVQQLNVGYMIRYGSNYGPALDPEEYKHLLVVDGEWWHGSGSSVARPMIQDSPYYEGDQYRYRTVTTCSTAGGGCTFPPLAYANVPGQEWRDWWPNGDEPFRIDDYLEQWIYYEAEFVAGGSISLYIYTRDGVFTGRYHSVPAMEGMQSIGGVDVLSYWEGASNTTADTYIELDFLRLSRSFMGPPDGFVGGPDRSGR